MREPNASQAVTDLASLIARVGDEAWRLGLRPCAVHFEVVPDRLLNTLTAYGGIVTRYRHWSFGKAYMRIRLAHQYRLLRMYELVVNANPATAYLLDSLSGVEQRLVIAHVLAHVDFFQHHYRFQTLPSDMPARMAWTRDRFEAWRHTLGAERLEQLLDDGLVASDLIDPYSRDWKVPSNVLGRVRQESAALGDTEREVLAALEEEARYFRPQLETKVANEGWATYWHRELMRSTPLEPADALEWARLEAQLLSETGSLNPYRLGLRLWDEVASQGTAALFRGRRLLSDQGLVEAYLTPEIAGMWAHPHERVESVRQRLLAQLDNGGLPRIVVEDVDRGELVLRHCHDGRDLAWADLPGAMAALARLWGQKVHLLTVRGGKARRLTWSGRDLTEEIIG